VVLGPLEVVPALLVNISLAIKNVAETNTPAYYGSPPVTKKKMLLEINVRKHAATKASRADRVLSYEVIMIFLATLGTCWYHKFYPNNKTSNDF
jgi:hypothetical protein